LNIPLGGSWSSVSMVGLNALSAPVLPLLKANAPDENMRARTIAEEMQVLRMLVFMGDFLFKIAKCARSLIMAG